MRDITRKFDSLRTASAVGLLLCSEETFERLQKDLLPKGPWQELVRAAGFLGAKQTQHLIPHCHPVSIDGFRIEYEWLKNGNHEAYSDEVQGKYGVVFKASGKSIGRTGIEMEVLTGLTVAALTLYDLLKPIDKNVEISGIKLLEKRGGKSDRQKLYEKVHTAAILVCSDRTAAGVSEDRSGVAIREILEGFNMDVRALEIVPDEKDAIRKLVQSWIEKDIQFIFTTGGTGLSPRDVTIEAISPMIEKEAVGIAEAMRQFGQSRTQVAMLSRQIVGTVNQSLIVCMPGNPKAVVDCLDAIFPAVLYARTVLTQGLNK